MYTKMVIPTMKFRTELQKMVLSFADVVQKCPHNLEIVQFRVLNVTYDIHILAHIHIL